MDSVATPLDVVKRYVVNFERKQRNLAKRKSKLDQYRDRLAKGESLNDEQKKAVDDYDSVVQNIGMLHEVISQSKELVDDVEEAVKNEESKIQLAHEQHTLSFLRMHLCLMRLLNSLDSSEVRLAVLRSASENHLKMLDAVRNMVTAPVLDNWPGTTPAGLAAAPAFVNDHPEVNSAALHAYHLVTGRPVPIPTPENYDGPPKKLNFKEARSLCLRLLATPAVIRALEPRSRTCSSTSTPDEHKCAQVVDPTDLSNVTPTGFRDGLQIRSDESTTHVNIDMHIPPTSHEQITVVPVPIILDQVIKPLGGTFNFLQASSISAAESLSEPPQAAFSKTPSNIQSDSSFTAVLDSVEVAECATPVSNEHCPPPSHAHDIAVPNLELNSETPDESHTLHTGESFDSHLKVETSVAEPSKPVSYADLVRRLSHARPANIRGRVGDAVSETHQSKVPSGQAGTVNFVNHEDEPLGISDAHFIPPSTSNRNPKDFRGGRMVGRPPMRGNYNGPVRRPIGGGSRPLRFAGASAGGGGGASFRGASASVPQPSY